MDIPIEQLIREIDALRRAVTLLNSAITEAVAALKLTPAATTPATPAAPVARQLPPAVGTDAERSPKSGTLTHEEFWKIADKFKCEKCGCPHLSPLESTKYVCSNCGLRGLESFYGKTLRFDKSPLEIKRAQQKIRSAFLEWARSARQ